MKKGFYETVAKVAIKRVIKWKPYQKKCVYYMLLLLGQEKTYTNGYSKNIEDSAKSG